jgi:hypothetical protein
MALATKGTSMSQQTGMRQTLIRACLGAFVALVTLAPTSRGEFIITFSESGGNVVANGTGSLNTTALTNLGTMTLVASVGPAGGIAEVGMLVDTVNTFVNISGPLSFGTGGLTFATSGTGMQAGVNIQSVNGMELLVSTSYKGGTFTNSSTWAGETISGLGLAPGTYEWTWGTGANADDLKLVVPSPAVPAPNSMILAVTAIGVVGFWVGIRRRRAAAAAA